MRARRLLLLPELAWRSLLLPRLASGLAAWADGKWYDAPEDFNVPVTICERPVVTSGTCSPGWVAFQGGCYLLVPRFSEYARATERCQDHAAALVSVGSAEENEFVRQLCGDRICWLGLREEPRSEVWRWSDGTPTTYRNWKPGEPNNYHGRDENAAMMNFHFGKVRKALAAGGWASGTWYDVPSTFDRPKAICESRRVPEGCNQDWDAFGASCYRLLDWHSDFAGASRRCQQVTGDFLEQEPAHLVTIGSEEEQAFVRQLCGTRVCWLGLRERPGSEADWEWVDGTPLAYENWEEGEPNDAGNAKSAVVMNFNIRWVDGGREAEGSNFEREEAIFLGAMMFFGFLMTFYMIVYGGVYIAALLCGFRAPGGPPFTAVAAVLVVLLGSWSSAWVFGSLMYEVTPRFFSICALLAVAGLCEVVYLSGLHLGYWKPPLRRHARNAVFLDHEVVEAAEQAE